jgi:hypothetical protein
LYFDVDVLEHLHLDRVYKVFLNIEGFEDGVLAHGVGD